MDEALDGRVGFLVERVESQLGVVWYHARLQGQKLPDDGVVPRVLPVDPAQNVGAIGVSSLFPWPLGFRVLRRGRDREGGGVLTSCGQPWSRL